MIDFNLCTIVRRACENEQSFGRRTQPNGNYVGETIVEKKNNFRDYSHVFEMSAGFEFGHPETRHGIIGRAVRFVGRRPVADGRSG